MLIKLYFINIVPQSLLNSLLYYKKSNYMTENMFYKRKLVVLKLVWFLFCLYQLVNDTFYSNYGYSSKGKGQTSHHSLESVIIIS